MLKGAQVLVTRPVHQAENLSSLIAEQGGIAIRFPTLAIVALADCSEIQKTLTQLDNYQWLVFISANAVTMHGNHSDSDKIKRFKSARIAAIGNATAKALVNAGWSVDLVADSGFNSEALLVMPEWQQITGQRFLIIRGQGGREELATVLQSRGATVDYLDVYKRIMPESDCSQVKSLLEQDKLDVITITSGEALQNLLVMLEQCFHERLFDIPLVVVSNRIRQIAAEIGFKRIAVTHSPSDSAILETVIMCVTGGIAWPN
jgi:uroporphyrinogen-III synthase